MIFLEAHLLLPPGYLGHSAHTPGSFSMSLDITLLQVKSCESVYGLARLHTPTAFRWKVKKIQLGIFVFVHFWKFLWTTYRNTDTIEGPALTCHQSVGAFS